MSRSLGALMLLVAGCTGRGAPDASTSDAPTDVGRTEVDGGLDAGADAASIDAPSDAGTDTGDTHEPDRVDDGGPPDVPHFDAPTMCPDVDLGSAVGLDLWTGSPWASPFTAAVCRESERGALRFAWRAPITGRYVALASPPYGAIELWDGCGGAELSCDGAGRVAFEATEGDDFVFYVSSADESPLSVGVVGALPDEHDASLCDNGIDEDADGSADCADDDCLDQPPCVEVCDDRVDNNGNGAVDCDDRDWCARFPGCFEICDNGADDDRDTLVDCDDPNCEVFPACTIDDPCHGYICPGHAPLCIECAGAPVCVMRGGTCP